MRMRRKKNLTARLANLNDYLIVPDNDELNFETSLKTRSYLDFEALFGNRRPTWLEIGCGKGRFACELAKQKKNINVLAVEKLSNIIVVGSERAQLEKISNLRFLQIGAEYLPKYIKKASVSRIYLNFSCPYPKARYESHRLTSQNFLKIYKELMAPGAKIYQKTDNRAFFEYSIEQLTQAGFAVNDLSQSPEKNNIITEYEERFLRQGKAIYSLIGIRN